MGRCSQGKLSLLYILLTRIGDEVGDPKHLCLVDTMARLP